MTQAFQEVGMTYMQNDTKLAGHTNFHQTEAGVIPIDWTAKQLKEVFALKNGYSFKGEFFSNDGPIVLTPGNFKLEGGLYFEARNTKRYCAEYPKGYEFEKGDLVVVMTDLTPDCNLLGKPAFVDFDEKVLHNQRIGKITQLVKNWDRRFLYYTLLSPAYLSNIKNAATGSTVRHTSPSTISGTWIAEPPPVEQTAIANALSDVDALIQELEKLIAKKQAIKTATMQQLLTGRTRLPQFAHHPDGHKKGYKPSELGEIPEDWECLIIGDLITDMRGGAPFKPSDFSQTGIKVLPKGGVVRGGVLRISEQDQQFCTYQFAKKFSKNCVNEKHTIVVLRDLVPSGPSIGLMVRIPKPEEYVLAQGVYGFIANTESVANYLIQYSNTSVYRRSANGTMVGSTQVHITNGAFKDMKIVMPSCEQEQTAIVTILSDVDSEIQSIEQRLNKTRQIKQGMMQELLTGKTRLVKPAEPV